MLLHHPTEITAWENCRIHQQIGHIRLARMGSGGSEIRGVGVDRRRVRFLWLADLQSGRGLQPLREDHKPLIDFREQRE